MQTSFLTKALLIAASLAATSPALATDFDAISIDVAISDLDLGQASDVARLQARLNRAADAVCASNGKSEVAERQHFGACKADALEMARTQMQRRIASAVGGSSPPLLAARR